jgi:hypothetical protein
MDGGRAVDYRCPFALACFALMIALIAMQSI